MKTLFGKAVFFGASMLLAGLAGATFNFLFTATSDEVDEVVDAGIEETRKLVTRQMDSRYG